MRITLLICVLTMALVSCDKDDKVVANFSDEALVGTWSRVDEIPSGLSEADFRYFNMETTQIFKIDGSHTYRVNMFGFNDENPNEIMAQTINNGTFEIRSDSVFESAFENISWVKGINTEPETITLNGEAYGSRFKIEGKTLALFYISYPADAPVPTESKLSKNGLIYKV